MRNLNKITKTELLSEIQELEQRVAELELQVTEKEQVASSLKQNASYLHAVIDNLPFEVWACNADGRYVLQNAQDIIIGGNHIGKTVEELNDWPEETLLHWEELDRRALNGEIVREEGERLIDGEKRYFSAFVGPIRSGDTILGILGGATDTTEQKHMAAVLRASEEKFSKAFYTSPDSININRLEDGMFLEVNDGFTKITGYTKEDVIGRSALEVNVWANPEERSRLVDELRSRGEVANFEATFRMKDGREKVGLMSASLIEIDGQLCILSITRDISERKQIEQKLLDSEERYRALVESSPTGIMLHRDENIFFANQAAIKILGASDAEELIGKNILDFIHPDYKQIVLDRAKLIRTQNQMAPLLEEKFLRLDGTSVDVEVAGVPFLSQGEQIVQVIITDITERKQAEEALRLTQLTVDRAPDAIHWVGSDGKLLYVNDAICQSLGYTREELLSMTVFDIDPLYPRNEWAEHWERERVLGYYILETMHKSKDGQIIPVEIVVNRVDYEGKEFNCAYARDITERKLAKEKLQESEEKFRSIVENALAGIFTIDNAYHFIYANDELCKILGYSEEQLLGMDFREVLSDDSRDLVAERYIRRQRGEEVPHRYEMSIIRGNSELRHAEMSVTAVKDKAGNSLSMGQLVDITERKRAERELQESEERFRSLFENSPVSLWEEDASEVRQYIEELKQSGITDLRAHFKANPESLKHCAQLYKVIRVNQATLDLFGASKSEDLNQAFSTIFIEETWDSFLEEILALADGETAFTNESSQNTLQGERLDIILQFNIPPGYESTWKRIFVSLVDITERRRAEEALQLTRFSVDHVADAVHWMNSDARIVDVNESACRMLGYSREEFLDMSLVDLDPGFSIENWPTTWKKIKKNGKHSLEAQHRAKDGRLIPVEIIANYIDFGGRELDCAVIRDITERKKAEQALRESEERLRQIASSLREVIWLRDAQTRHVLYVNPAFEELTGRTCESFYENQNIVIDVIHPDDKESVIKALEQRFEGIPYDEEHRIVHLDGSVRWVSSRIFPVLNRAGEVYRWASIMEDITERKQSETALKESEERLRLALDGTTDGIWDWNISTGQVYFSPRYYAMLGYEPDEFPASYENWRQLLHPEDAEATENALLSAVEEKTPFAIEFRCKAKNGEWRWILGRGKVVELDEEDNAIRLAGSHTDISERKQVETELRVKNQLVDAILKYAPIGFAVSTIDEGLVVFGSSKFEELYGIPPGSVNNIDEFFEKVYLDPVFREQMRERILADITSGDPSRMHWENIPITTATGDHKVITASNIPLWEQNLMISTVQDVTKRAQAEDEILRLNKELEQRVVERTAQLEAANKELEAFSYSVSHDLRAPLRAIDGFSRILIEDHSQYLPDEVLRLLGIVRSNTQQMGILIDDLLTFSRLSRQPVSKRTINMIDLVRQVLDTLNAETEGREVEIKIGKLPECEGDQTLLKQVWINLLSNALKFTLERDVARIEIGCNESESEQVYFVKDNGVGFDMQYVGKLFGVFQRLHRSEEYEGTGVGLAIVQRIVHRHGGRVWAESEPNAGTTFYFTV